MKKQTTIEWFEHYFPCFNQDASVFKFHLSFLSDLDRQVSRIVLPNSKYKPGIIYLNMKNELSGVVFNRNLLLAQLDAFYESVEAYSKLKREMSTEEIANLKVLFENIKFACLSLK